MYPNKMDRTNQNLKPFLDCNSHQGQSNSNPKSASCTWGQGHGQSPSSANFSSHPWNMCPTGTQDNQNQWFNAIKTGQPLTSTSADCGMKKRKANETDLMEMDELEYSEYRVSKISAIENGAKDQFFEDGNGYLWDDKEEEEMTMTTGTDANFSGFESKLFDHGVHDEMMEYESFGGRDGPVKIAKRRILPQSWTQMYIPD